MRDYRGRARNALARTLEPPQRGRFEVRPWGALAWLVVGLLLLASLVARR